MGGMRELARETPELGKESGGSENQPQHSDLHFHHISHKTPGCWLGDKSDKSAGQKWRNPMGENNKTNTFHCSFC